MLVSFFLWQALAFAIYFVSSSFVEWLFHRYAFHTPRVCRAMFRAHTLVHHQVYKGDDSYRTDDDHPQHVPMNWWTLPAILAVYLPIFSLIQRITGIPSLWGGLLAVSAYYGIYESIHWAMHVPRAARFLGRFRAYRFLDAHHHVHHRYMLSNLNVVLPLADLLLGTLRDRNGKRVRLFPSNDGSSRTAVRPNRNVAGAFLAEHSSSAAPRTQAPRPPISPIQTSEIG